jgi:hypothetical protein
MKGLSLDLYRLRAFGDLDVLVRKEDLTNAIELLHRLDYAYFVGSSLERLLTSREKSNISLQLSWNNHYQLRNARTGLLLELHTNLFQRARVYVEDLDTLLDNIDLFWEGKRYDAEMKCFTLSREHSLLLMCLHNAINRSPSNNRFLFRTCADIDMLIDRGVKWDGFVEACHRLRCAPWVYFSLLLTEQLLDTGIPADVLAALKNDCTRWQLYLIDVHLRCLRSLRFSSIFYSKLYRFLNPFVFGRRWKDRIKWLLLLPILFPPRRQMARNFNVREDSPVVYLTYLLNPLRWLYLVATRAWRR